MLLLSYSIYLNVCKVEGDSYLWLDSKEFTDCTITLKARKLEGREGFRIFFGSKGEKQYYMLSSANSDDENSFANPEKVVPIETVLKGLKPSFDMVCQPNSFTILRIPVE